MIKFHGSLGELQERIAQCEVRGEWRHITASGLHQFKAETGENLNWWPSTGRITFQGGDVPILQDRYMLRYLPSELRGAAGGHGKPPPHRQCLSNEG